MKQNTQRSLKARGLRSILLAALLTAPAAVCADDPGRLFYTPAQRVQLEQARARNITQRAPGTQGAAAAPLRYDGVLIRSDGRSTHWLDGRPQLDSAGTAGLKPGQIRADGKVYEPYQVLRPAPPAAPAQPAAPATDAHNKVPAP